MHRETKTKSWMNVKDSDIAQQIAGMHGLTADVQATTEVFKHVFQDALTDMAFLQQRAARIGYEVFLQENKLYFRKPEPVGSAVPLEWGTELQRFHPRLTVTEQVNEVMVRGWDPKTKKEIVGQASSSNSHPSVGFGKSGGQAAQSAMTAAKKIEVRCPVQSQADATAVAKAILDEINGNGSGFKETRQQIQWQVSCHLGSPHLQRGGCYGHSF
jgi:uncharacterized protein